MLISRNTAKSLLSGAELALFDAARRDAIKALEETQVRADIERARRLREKYRPAALDKALLFDQLVARFQRRLDHLEHLRQKAREIADRAIGVPPPPPRRKPRRGGPVGLRVNVPRSGPGSEDRRQREFENIIEARKLGADPVRPRPRENRRRKRARA
jgi:hypothetical protein